VSGAVVIGGAAIAASAIVTDSPAGTSAESAVSVSEGLGTTAMAPVTEGSTTDAGTAIVSMATVSASGAGAGRPQTTDGREGAAPIERRRSSDRELPDVSTAAGAAAETERLVRRVGAEPAEEGSNDKRRALRSWSLGAQRFGLRASDHRPPFGATKVTIA
jgi:hypothetical protein